MAAIHLDYDMLHKAAQQMEREGGTFARHIALAFFVADAMNQEALVRAFDDLFLQFYRKYRRDQRLTQE